MARISQLLQQKDNLYTIKTNKYKDINVSFKFAIEYTDKLKSALLVLSLMLKESCKKYPTKQDLAKATDMLYGMSYDCLCLSVSNLLVLTISYSFPNPRFFNDVNEDDYIDFINSTIKDPNFNEKSLLESKRIIIDNLNRKLDNPSSFANNEFSKIVAGDDDRYNIAVLSSSEEIQAISINDVIDAYNLLLASRIDIYLIGDYSNKLKDYLASYKSYKEFYPIVNPLNLYKKEDITYKKEIGQSTLLVSYKCPYVRNSKEYYAFNLGNILFGGIPTSLLFQEVREKENLCYVIYSKALRYEGLLFVSTLIDAKNKERALAAINKQYKRMIDKDYDPSLLDIAKKLLITNSLTIDDDLDYLIDYHYKGILTNTYISMDDYIKEVEKVTIDDISSVFSNIEPYLVYFLEGTLNEKDL